MRCLKRYIAHPFRTLSAAMNPPGVSGDLWG